MSSLGRKMERGLAKKVARAKKRLQTHPNDILKFKNKEEAEHFMRTMYQQIHGKPMESGGTWTEHPIENLATDVRIPEDQRAELLALAQLEKEKN